jgi:hypothetical protein
MRKSALKTATDNISPQQRWHIQDESARRYLGLSVSERQIRRDAASWRLR